MPIHITQCRPTASNVWTESGHRRAIWRSAFGLSASSNRDPNFAESVQVNKHIHMTQTHVWLEKREVNISTCDADWAPSHRIFEVHPRNRIGTSLPDTSLKLHWSTFAMPVTVKSRSCRLTARIKTAVSSLFAHDFPPNTPRTRNDNAVNHTPQRWVRDLNLASRSKQTSHHLRQSRVLEWRPSGCRRRR